MAKNIDELGNLYPDDLEGFAAAGEDPDHTEQAFKLDGREV